MLKLSLTAQILIALVLACVVGYAMQGHVEFAETYVESVMRRSTLLEQRVLLLQIATLSHLEPFS